MINKSIFDVKQLKVNKFINSMQQLIISASNATLKVPSLRPWVYNKTYVNISSLLPVFKDL